MPMAGSLHVVYPAVGISIIIGKGRHTPWQLKFILVVRAW